MEASSMVTPGLPFSPSRIHPLLTGQFKSKSSALSIINIAITNGHYPPVLKMNTKMKKKKKRISAVVSDVLPAAVADPVQAEVTWQIVIGAIAGTTPFVVAGIEFSKRIVAQQRCEVCKGSGLVLRDNKYYFRCPGCGGFLPWQSWKRFFSG